MNDFNGHWNIISWIKDYIYFHLRSSHRPQETDTVEDVFWLFEFFNAKEEFAREEFLRFFKSLPKRLQTQHDADFVMGLDPKLMFQHVRSDLQTPEMCQKAIEAHPLNFWHVKHKTKEITNFAIEENPVSSHWVQLILFRFFGGWVNPEAMDDTKLQVTYPQ